MAERVRPDEPGKAGEEVAWDRGRPDAEPEPEWADAIREGRKARGERLKEVFASSTTKMTRGARRSDGR